MAAKYIQGVTVKARAEFKNFGGALIDPPIVYLKYRTPDDTIITETSGVGGNILRISLGIYEIYVLLDKAGKYIFRWEGTGPESSVTETTINVAASKVIE